MHVTYMHLSEVSAIRRWSVFKQIFITLSAVSLGLISGYKHIILDDHLVIANSIMYAEHKFL